MERDFKGIWIPKEIWLSDKLTLQEKVFLAEIDSLDNRDGCYASNAHFADFFKLSRNRCSEVIKSLEKKGFIILEYIRPKGQTNIEKRVIKIVGKSNTPIREVDKASREVDRPIRESGRGCSGKLEGNNTINNTDNIYSLFEHWNSKEIIKHRKMNKQMESHINARLQEYSLDELKKAIDNYATIIQSEKYFFDYKWTLQDFMKPNNVPRFLDKSQPLSNFLKTQHKQIEEQVQHDPRNMDIAFQKFLDEGGREEDFDWTTGGARE